MDEKSKLKNLKDLEYNHIISKQNVSFVLVGTAIISVMISDPNLLPSDLSKSDLILFFILAGIVFFLYFGRKLNEIEEEIKRL